MRLSILRFSLLNRCLLESRVVDMLLKKKQTFQKQLYWCDIEKKGGGGGGGVLG